MARYRRIELWCANIIDWELACVSTFMFYPPPLSSLWNRQKFCSPDGRSMSQKILYTGFQISGLRLNSHKPCHRAYCDCWSLPNLMFDFRSSYTILVDKAVTGLVKLHLEAPTRIFCRTVNVYDDLEKRLKRLTDATTWNWIIRPDCWVRDVIFHKLSQW